MPVPRPRPATTGCRGAKRGTGLARAAALVAVTAWLAVTGLVAATAPATAATAPEPAGPPPAKEGEEAGGPGFRTQSAALLVMDPASGQILWQKNGDEPRHPASISKLMTLLLTLEAIDAGQIRLQDQVTVSPRAQGTPGITAFL